MVFYAKKLDIIHETRKKFEDNGIEIICINSGVSYAKADSAERELQTVQGKDYIDIAAGLGSKYVRVFGGKINKTRLLVR